MFADFEQWVRDWLANLYERRDAMLRRADAAVEAEFFDREAVFLKILVGLCLVGLCLLPLIGAIGVFGSLGALYLGSAIGAVVVLRKARQLDQARRLRPVVAERVEWAWRALQPIDAETRAYLTRLINLTPVASTDRGRPIFVREVEQARQAPRLAAWPAWDDVVGAATTPVPVNDDEFSPRRPARQ